MYVPELIGLAFKETGPPTEDLENMFHDYNRFKYMFKGGAVKAYQQLSGYGTPFRAYRRQQRQDGDTASGPRRRRDGSSVVRFGELGHVNKNIHDRVQVHPKGNDPRMKRDDIGYP
ncbi:hypothetical protein EVAR_98511_1 [Eumeta japonica]|uniref:Uncharacterized protein n=1 Tax=Eumeta variegata TaxID=151549 RepID=A0A4C2ACZ7_EUMVA|nr:hypothetical protein EVAR_98511_1 [Eumeta japonica]